MAGMTVFAMAACAKEPEVFTSESDNGKIVNLFGPMEKSKPDKNNIARNAFDMTIAIAGGAAWSAGRIPHLYSGKLQGKNI